jgi:hypothetical protein
MNKKRWHLTLTLLAALAVAFLAGCSQQADTPAESNSPTVQQSAPGQPGGLDPTNQLVLGTLKLEGTADAVTPGQAADLLPLWQMIAGGSLEGDVETQAVLKQIEAKMSDGQQAAIEAMALTGQDMTDWAKAQGIEVQAPPAAQGGGPGALQNLSEDERAKMREEFQNMTAEERATRMAELGVQRPEGGGPGGTDASSDRPAGGGRMNILLTPLINLLAERAAG